MLAAAKRVSWGEIEASMSQVYTSQTKDCKPNGYANRLA
jgi:hypothetical protein